MTNRRIVLYDFDGTLTHGDSFWRFIVYSYGWWRFIFGLIANLPWLIAYKLGMISNHDAKQRLFSWYFKGMDACQFEKLGVGFFNKNGAKLLRKGVKDKINAQKAQGIKVAIVTASLDGWVRPFQRFLGADMLLCTQAEIDSDGRLTGRFSCHNCHGAEKVRRIREAIPDLESYYIEAYGDSAGDEPMLALAQEPHYKDL